MIELNRHIEILLLNNDCVIVPGLGGFMAHHVEARYVEDEQVFLPPLRTLGFNPQLKINDSLLAQSYIEAYDISYPEAIQRIEEEVNEMQQILQSEGRYELNNIGILELNEDGNYVFTPCEAGILTPSLYGLNSFEMKLLSNLSKPQPQEQEVVAEEKAVKPESEVNSVLQQNLVDINEDDNDVVRIKFTWIRNAVAVAAILLAVFFIAMPTGKTDLMKSTINNLNNQLLFGMMTSKDTNTSAIDFKRKDAQKPAVKTAEAILDTIKPATSAQAAKPVAVKADSAREGYCIVLASHVNKHNAEDFINRLAKRGYKGAEIYVHKNVTRIVYGHFMNQADAYNQLHKLTKEKELEESWVYKYNEKSE
ncbi:MULTISPECIES: SPOR domain-containing protein [unclassified Prevotella]|uniref:HU domain-containing protein n=1 Tax=unclassified Prevotella TaxID=2638335 RepID=UPI00048AFD9C